MKARILIFSRAKKEPWQEECYRAYVSVLMLNTEQAYFEVSKNTDSMLYYPSFWYGNTGGHMEHTRPCGNKEEAMKLCQEEFDRLISENAIDSIMSKQRGVPMKANEEEHCVEQSFNCLLEMNHCISGDVDCDRQSVASGYCKYYSSTPPKPDATQRR